MSEARWRAASVAIVAAVAAIAALIGFVWMPYAQPGAAASGLWDAICRAAGAPQPFVPSGQPTTLVARASRVIVTPGMMGAADPSSIGRGATLALRCTMCHGARGVSDANTPNLAGQDAGSIYKQLRDFRAGNRASAVMAPLVKDLSDGDMRDVSAYYASLPLPRNTQGAALAAPVIVADGAPMRNVAPCDSCHGAGYVRVGTPYLDGQPYAYLRAQLYAFTTGTRRNDLREQMRNVARQMTNDEIEAAARHYSSR